MAAADDNVALVVVRPDGVVLVWCGVETRKQKRWVVKRLRDAKKLIEAGNVV